MVSTKIIFGYNFGARSVGIWSEEVPSISLNNILPVTWWIGQCQLDL